MLPVLHMLNSGHTSQKCNIHVTCYDKMCSFVDKHWIVSSGKVLTGLWVVLNAHQWMPDCLATRSPAPFAWVGCPCSV